MTNRQPDRPPLLLHVFPSFETGGVPLRIVNIINHFGARYRHMILACDGDYHAAGRLDPSLGVALADPVDQGGGLGARLWRYRGVLRRLRPDLLLTYNWAAVEWAAANLLAGNPPHIHFESGFSVAEAERQIPRRVWFRRFALKGARRVVVPSSTLRRIATGVWRLPAEQVALTPNGVDYQRYDCEGDLRYAPGFAPQPGKVVVGTVAPLRPEKNIGRLLRAFAALDQSRAQLLIVGDGNERGALQEQARALGLDGRVTFTGHCDAPEKVYRLMDIFAISSDTEQMPNALIQAMAAGRPVAGLAVGDVRPIVADENRPFIAPAGDDAGFTAALRALAEDGALRLRLGAANRKQIEQVYGFDRMASAYENLYESAMA